MAGVSTPFSVGRELEKGKSREQLLLRVIKRTLILVLLGLFVNNGLKIQPLADIRFPSVLGRIGIAYMIANIIYLYAKEWTLAIWFCFFIVGYYLLLKFTSAPGFAHGDLTPQGNFASYMDRTLFTGQALCTLPQRQTKYARPGGFIFDHTGNKYGPVRYYDRVDIKKQDLNPKRQGFATGHWRYHLFGNCPKYGTSISL